MVLKPICMYAYIAQTENGNNRVYASKSLFSSSVTIYVAYVYYDI